MSLAREVGAGAAVRLRRAMMVPILLSALVVLVALLVWARRLRASGGRAAAAEDSDSVPLDRDSTRRAYVIPGRLLRSAPRSTGFDDAADHPRYVRAALERVAEAGATSARWELLRGRTRLGREADNHVVLDDERVSLHHAQITVRDGVYWLEDLGSTNGTFVGDGQRVMTPHPLADGDELRLGTVVLAFRGASG